MIRPTGTPASRKDVYASTASVSPASNENRNAASQRSSVRCRSATFFEVLDRDFVVDVARERIGPGALIGVGCWAGQQDALPALDDVDDGSAFVVARVCFVFCAALTLMR